MSLVRLSLRNLLRTPRRTALTVVAIVAGVAISILGQGFIGGFEESIIVGATDGTVGHVLARPADYPTQGMQYPVDKLVKLNAETRALLDAETEAWTERLFFAPIVAHGNDSLRVMAVGMDPVRDPKVFPRHLWKVTGALPAEGAREVAVSPRVAQLLGVKVGDTLVLQVKTHRGAINAFEVAVSGIVRTSNSAIDLMGMHVSQALSRELLLADAPSHLSVRLRDRDQAPAFAAKLGAALGAQAEVVTWQGETAELIRLQQVRRKALNFVVFILMALAGFGIANTILMAAYERTREVGTLRSMGMTESGVVRLFLLEGGLMGLVGGLLGAAIGGGLVAYWSRHPIDFTEVLETQMRTSMAMSSLVYTKVDTAMLVGAVALGVLVAVLASIYPARVASNMVPADAVRGT